jgi:hypothetical protein
MAGGRIAQAVRPAIAIIPLQTVSKDDLPFSNPPICGRCAVLA